MQTPANSRVPETSPDARFKRASSLQKGYPTTGNFFFFILFLFPIFILLIFLHMFYDFIPQLATSSQNAKILTDCDLAAVPYKCFTQAFMI